MQASAEAFGGIFADPAEAKFISLNEMLAAQEDELGLHGELVLESDLVAS